MTRVATAPRRTDLGPDGLSTPRFFQPRPTLQALMVPTRRPSGRINVLDMAAWDDGAGESRTTRLPCAQILQLPAQVWPAASKSLSTVPAPCFKSPALRPNSRVAAVLANPNQCVLAPTLGLAAPTLTPGQIPVVISVLFGAVYISYRNFNSILVTHESSLILFSGAKRFRHPNCYAAIGPSEPLFFAMFPAQAVQISKARFRLL
jgi:hypothetical protein